MPHFWIAKEMENDIEFQLEIGAFYKQKHKHKIQKDSYTLVSHLGKNAHRNWSSLANDLQRLYDSN